MSEPLTIALIGNPNTGKSTLFNALSGSRALTGNYPGVTVEKKIGRTQFEGRQVDVVDLPGTYSLAPRSIDEMVAVNVLLGRQADVNRPDVVVCIVDASNIERNLYLVSQVLDLRLPVVVVLNMCDVAAERGIQIYESMLSCRLGLPVVRTEAHRQRGIDDVRKAVLSAAAGSASATAKPPEPGSSGLKIFPEAFRQECQALSAKLTEFGRTETPEYLLERMLLDVGGWLETHAETPRQAELTDWLHQARARLAEQGCPVPAVEARSRYAWVRKVLDGVLVKPTTRPVTFSDKLDRVLTHHIAGMAVFVVLMLIVFQAIYRGAEPVKDLFTAGQQWVAGLVGGLLPPGPLNSLLVDGVVGGVGSVLVFLPQIVVLFLFIALLEDCGYMARAAFLMDRLMTRVGLSGKSFVPLMSSFACAVPGIMATRVIENRRDRFTTILVAPLMSCSARQPVYWLMIAAFFPATYYVGGWVGLRELTMFGMTSLGALVAIPVAWLLKQTFFRGETPPFVMELPGYKWPSPRLVLNRVYDRARAFVVRAGTLIFATNILVWGAGYFPGDHTQTDALQVVVDQAQEELAVEKEARLNLETRQQELAALLKSATTEQQTLELKTESTDVAGRLSELDQKLESLSGETALKVADLNRQRSELLENSLLGRLGHAIEPVVAPLGWDWRIGVGVLASFPAREVIIGTLGTIYSMGGDEEGLPTALQAARRPDGRPVYSIPVALSIMVFFALCAQCSSTLMVIHRETNDWRWALFTFAYMTILAYLGAFLTYQGTRGWL
ncbi:MAG: ferrous iron transport protein B [Planctomycetota bacterium]|nr:ferrous iron transport protein B [Planctomycetota bacterium]